MPSGGSQLTRDDQEHTDPIGWSRFLPGDTQPSQVLRQSLAFSAHA